ncbi:hypothetical protein CHLRE_15g641050v5 [Chlamydomonas reinhardtii]|uniref:Uncharacterized protein n=1 Tax=Chlamydomonas reinhardtii TaxID=3055 RepID=A0A2K3CWU6_CHLRE|nr:uncharacterized protein CHLRE_15g641050v5 [Chlamydomonas reinhardtii]PNW72751.1 hypothetical protein CHLRE_15g641050v5 [Chlamydomonas reinhardtii]
MRASLLHPRQPAAAAPPPGSCNNLSLLSSSRAAGSSQGLSLRGGSSSRVLMNSSSSRAGCWVGLGRLFSSRVLPAERSPRLAVYGFAEREGRYNKRPRSVKARAAQQATFKMQQMLLLDDPRILKADTVSGKSQFAKGFNSIQQQFVKWAEEDYAARDAVNKINTTLQQVKGLKTSRIIKAGSVGRGTQVTRAHDVDLLVPVGGEWGGHDLSDLTTWKNEPLLENVRRAVKDELQRANPEWSVSIHNLAHYGRVLLVRLGDVEVDLLLIPDCVKASPPPSNTEWTRLQYLAVMGPVLAHPDTAVYDQVRERAASPAWIEFMATMPPYAQVKDVVCLVKGLYKLGGVAPAAADDDDRRIRSIALEVLVVAAHQRLRQRWEAEGRREYGGNTYKLDLFIEFLQLVVAAVRKREVVMVDAAGPWGCSPELGMRCRRNWEHDAIHIICPWDPTCNLERARKDRGPADWDALATMAEELLQLLQHRGVGTATKTKTTKNKNTKNTNTNTTFADFLRHSVVAAALDRATGGDGGGGSRAGGGNEGNEGGRGGWSLLRRIADGGGGGGGGRGWSF